MPYVADLVADVGSAVDDQSDLNTAHCRTGCRRRADTGDRVVADSEVLRVANQHAAEEQLVGGDG